MSTDGVIAVSDVPQKSRKIQWYKWTLVSMFFVGAAVMVAGIGIILLGFGQELISPWTGPGPNEIIITSSRLLDMVVFGVLIVALGLALVAPARFLIKRTL